VSRSWMRKRYPLGALAVKLAPVRIRKAAAQLVDRGAELFVQFGLFAGGNHFVRTANILLCLAI
jgi:hypothetical protein